MTDFRAVSLQLVELLKAQKHTITTAESCTGGMIAAAITGVPGSSAVFPGAIVSYCDEVKASVFSVPKIILESEGAVSEPVAWSMARGAARMMDTDLALSATGLAGPDGDGSANPIGTVYLGLYACGDTLVEHHVFTGDRDSIRRQATEAALNMALRWLGGK